MEKIGIITSGGDCAGLNAIIKGVAHTAIRNDASSYVIPNGYAGLYNLVDFDELVELTEARMTSMEVGLAGSEAGHSRVKIDKIKDPNKYERIKEGLKKFGIEGLVICGGDDTGSVVVDLVENGINCVHAPKTMDLDLQTYSVGGDSTVSRIAKFSRDIKTTGRTHNRIIIVEVFGRYAGHTAFRGGIAAEADAILIPEIAVDFNIVYEHMKERYFDRIKHSDVSAGIYLIVVAEGLKDASGSEIVDESAGTDAFGHKKLAGSGSYVRQKLEEGLSQDAEIKEKMKEAEMFVKDIYEEPEIRTIVPGHLVRSGESSAFDVNFGLEIGSAAVRLLMKGINGVTIANVKGDKIKYMKTEDAIVERKVNLDQVTFHENMGICFGREEQDYDFECEELDESPDRHL